MADIPVKEDLPFPFANPNQVETDGVNVREIPEPLQRPPFEVGHQRFQHEGVVTISILPPGWGTKDVFDQRYRRLCTSR